MATSPTFGKILKIDSYSNHTPEVRHTSIPSSSRTEAKQVKMRMSIATMGGRATARCRHGSFPLHVYVCLLASMLYLRVTFSRSRLCHASFPLWACACVITSVPPRDWLGVTTCEIHFHGVWCWYACLAFFVPPVWLSLFLCILFACLPICSWLSLYFVHSTIQWNYVHSIQTYICPFRTPPFVW